MPWKKNRSESNLFHLGVEQECPVCLTLTALAPFRFSNRTHTGLPALPDTVASIVAQVFKESYWLVQTS